MKEQVKVVAYDDEGKAITEDDLIQESYRRPPEGAIFELASPFDFEGDEDEWETLCLIKQVQARRLARSKT